MALNLIKYININFSSILFEFIKGICRYKMYIYFAFTVF